MKVSVSLPGRIDLVEWWGVLLLAEARNILGGYGFL